MLPPLSVVWDDEPGGNVAHLAEHGVAPEAAEAVLARFFHEREASRSSPQRWVVMGDTRAGRFLVVVFEWDEALGVVVPITAYEPQKWER